MFYCLNLLSQELIQENINGEAVNFKKVNVVDNKIKYEVDNILYIKKNDQLYQRVIDKNVNVRWFGAKGDGKNDDTKAIQKAISTGFPVEFGKGVFLVSSLTLPYYFKGLSLEGVGYNHWDDTAGTVLKAIGNQSILNPVNGCDWIRISNLRLDGANISDIGFNGQFGAGIIFQNVGVYNFKKYGVLSRQGLLRISECFFSNNKIGVELYSDSTISNTEITGGEICLRIVSGGNRLNNIWLNTSTESLLHMEPLDAQTGHQNTSMNNLYLGEVMNKTPNEKKFQVVIKGNDKKRIQQVQITNSFFVHATNTVGNNTFFSLDKADEIIISNCNFLGQNTYAKGNVYTDHFIVASDSHNIKIANNIIKGVNNSAIEIVKYCNDWSVLGNDFINCGGMKQNAVILVNSQNESRMFLQANRFIDYRDNKNIFALKCLTEKGCNFKDNYIIYPNSTVDESGNKVNTQLEKNFR
ncbi:hypothetical protein IQ37_06215 [Chryseobacterium piperi]|uniref:Rhamnogalacturonase A/B/Epimerase-like pectate lyase domain-containing protein n=2 Tax=Chryseobacterium piperi TaxID=558152 RepID=A0A086BKC6_9FLAO|nr:hypothetical protein CJF12_19090 [Chryseobacterium piperi]KFF29390.1 hypothetical protein IQ37_06215 [Chryseobacterium piperi]